MLSRKRKTLGVAGAAILGTAGILGTNATNAAINLDFPDDEDAGQAVTYAKETLTSSVEVGGKKYYVVNGGEAVLDVEAQLGIGATNDSLVVTYTFENMVLTSESAPTLIIGDDSESPATKGKKGDGSVVFTLVSKTTAKNEVITLQLKEIAVAADAAGSITMTVTSGNFAALLKNEQYAKNVVKTAMALKETVSSTDVTATVGSGFTKFSSTTAATSTSTIASVGSIKLTLSDPVPFGATTAKKIEKMEELYADAESKVTFNGEISFAHDVQLADTAACGGGTSILDKDTNGNVKSPKALTVQKPSAAGATKAKHLCIKVDGKTAMPFTAPYTVTTAYKGFSAAAAFPPSGKTTDLGRIRREGTTVYIPFLTTNERYNQRLIIVNRGSSAAKYSLEFTEEAGVKATPGSDASGMLAAKETKTLSLLRGDVVTLENSNRISATLTVEASSAMIDVSTVLVNVNTQSTDTVMYTAAQ